MLVHVARHVRVGVECEARIRMSEQACQSFGIHSALYRVRCEGMAQVVESYQRKLRSFEYSFKLVIRRRRI